MFAASMGRRSGAVIRQNRISGLSTAMTYHDYWELASALEYAASRRDRTNFKFAATQDGIAISYDEGPLLKILYIKGPEDWDPIIKARASKSENQDTIDKILDVVAAENTDIPEIASMSGVGYEPKGDGQYPAYILTNNGRQALWQEMPKKK